MPTSTQSRRDFLRCSAYAALAASALPRRSAAAADYPPGKYVDVHVHIGTIPVNKNDPLTAYDLLRWMDSRDISQAWVLPLVSPEAYPNPVSTEYVLEQTREHRDRLIPFCVIDPRNSWYGKRPKLTDQLKKYIDAGAKGFGEHKPGIAVDDPRNLEVYAGCQELNLPVLFHLDSARNTDDPGLPALDKVLGMFPDLTFIGHSVGFWASISGDVKTRADLGRYPRGPVVPGGALDRLLEKHNNLYADMSSGSGANAFKRDMTFAADFIHRWQDRLLFGTDYLTEGWDTGQHELFAKFDLSEEVQAKLFRTNARKLLAPS